MKKYEVQREIQEFYDEKMDNLKMLIVIIIFIVFLSGSGWIASKLYYNYELCDERNIYEDEYTASEELRWIATNTRRRIY